jgi:hypothetical protein
MMVTTSSIIHACSGTNKTPIWPSLLRHIPTPLLAKLRVLSTGFTAIGTAGQPQGGHESVTYKKYESKPETEPENPELQFFMHRFTDHRNFVSGRSVTTT